MLPPDFVNMLSDPAPGLLFGPHEGAGVGERAYPTPHAMAPPASRSEFASLGKLTRGNPALADLEDFYSRWNGGRFCTLHDSLNERKVGAIDSLPISEWAEATQPYIDGDMAWSMEGCEMYNHGTWRVIAQLHSEGTALVIFFDGEFEGAPLAGRMFAISLDPILGYEELLAPSFSAFLEELARDPAAFFERVGFVWSVQSEGGQWYGDPVAAYLPDVRKHLALRKV